MKKTDYQLAIDNQKQTIQGVEIADKTKVQAIHFVVVKVGNPQRMTSLSSATPGNIRIKISSMVSRESRKCMGRYENGALKGKLGIANEQKLRKVEYMTVAKRSATLPARPTALRRYKQQAWLDQRCP